MEETFEEEYGPDTIFFSFKLKRTKTPTEVFEKMDITDDYGLSNDFLESKKYKLSLRELTPEELDFAKHIYHSGAKLHTDFILAVIYKQLDMSHSKKWYKHINIEIPYAEDNLLK